MRRLWKGRTERKEQDGTGSTGSGHAEEAFEVTAGDFEEVGGGEPKGAKEAFGVPGKVKREMTGAGRRDAGEGEVL